MFANGVATPSHPYVRYTNDDLDGSYGTETATVDRKTGREHRRTDSGQPKLNELTKRFERANVGSPRTPPLSISRERKAKWQTRTRGTRRFFRSCPCDEKTRMQSDGRVIYIREPSQEAAGYPSDLVNLGGARVCAIGGNTRLVHLACPRLHPFRRIGGSSTRVAMQRNRRARRAARENGPFGLMALEETREVEGRSFFSLSSFFSLYFASCRRCFNASPS